MSDGRFWHHFDKRYENECTEMREVVEHHLPGKRYGVDTNMVKRWYIKMWFAGYNSRANNGIGYASKGAAEAACLNYQRRK